MSKKLFWAGVLLLNLLVALKIVFAMVSNDAAYYYTQSHLLGSGAGVPLGAVLLPTARHTYLVQPVSVPSVSAPQIPTPSCPAGFIPQIFVTPAGFMGAQIKVFTGSSLAQGSGIVTAVHGIYAYTKQSEVGVGGWDVYMSALGAQGVVPLTQADNAWVMVVTSCCNPLDPASNCVAAPTT